ncbi:DUF742 domain-containing protein [Asanoa iriomotensis]|uniref:DUF742 domain-containing protein n=1 Tax=Asanoa iriomotensis TaxID=234613 RepID=A0ABQ4CAI0_9ACTN|nr:DUF742 domain-containing protein [Asanoa iriomotensis]GIF59778.1 hypothetical protein Air01nite_58730 [Asanoa iriomotensis]
MTDGWDDAESLVPLYVQVKGRALPRAQSTLDISTQVLAMPMDPSRLEPEARRLYELCYRWQSVAEISAHLRRTLTSTKVLVDVLLEEGYLTVGAERPMEQRETLQLVLDGLLNL